MNITNMEVLRENAMNEFDKAVNFFEGLEPMKYSDIDVNETMFVMVDMINSFAKKDGALYSPNVEMLIPKMGRFIFQYDEDGGITVAYADSHPKNAEEFKRFPPHGEENTAESEIVDEFKGVKNLIRVEKNSTNGVLAADPLDIIEAAWEINKNNIKTILVGGDLSEECVTDFAVTMKQKAEQENRDIKVIAIEDFISTYDSPTHNAEYEHVMAMYRMQRKGVEVVKTIEYDDMDIR